MSTFCDDFSWLPSARDGGGERGGRTRSQMGEGRRERETKLWMFCTDGKDGEPEVPKQDLLRGMSL